MQYVQKSFTFNGKRYYVKGTPENIDEKLEQKRNAVQSKSIKLKDWFPRYIKVYKSNTLQTTRDSYLSIYEHALSSLGDKYLTEITPIECQEVLNSLSGRSKTYLDFAKGLLSDSFEKAIDNGFALTNPCKHIVLPKTVQNQRRALSVQERRKLESIISKDGKAYLFCRIMYYCGLRPSEVCRIKGQDIKGNNLTVRGTKTKNSSRTVPIPSTVRIPFIAKEDYLFKSYKGHIGTGSPKYYWELIKKEFGQTDLTLYCLRHDYCTRLQEAGVPIDVARRLMGHSTIQLTSKIYTHANEKSFEDARKLIEFYVEHQK